MQEVPQQPVPAQQRFAVVPQVTGAAAGHVQLPPAQDAPDAQTLPQLPQLPSSVPWSTQTPGLTPQTFEPAGQVHVPAPHVAPVAQGWSQVPQFRSSVPRSTQAVEQASGRVAGHWQVPPLQRSPASGQTLRQLPQFDASLAVFTQRGQRRSGHGVAPGSQPHAPPEQVPRPQGRPQPPQWAALVCVSTQAPPQSASPVGHSQTPATQAAPVEHARQPLPHAFASVWVSTQRPKQRVWPASHFCSSGGQPRSTVAIATAAAASLLEGSGMIGPYAGFRTRSAESVGPASRRGRPARRAPLARGGGIPHSAC